MTLDALRRLFPHTEDTIYFNHAATGPLSRPVVEAVERYLEQRHRTNIENYFDLVPVIAEAKQRIATVLGTEASRVEFAPNTTSALDVLARGLGWQPGDRVAVPACEFPANVYPFMGLERLGVGVDLIPHERGVVTVESIERSLTPQTRLLTLSWVQFLSGFRADLAAVGRLCRERGVLFCVDAIQGLGAFRLDVEACGIDFLACGGQKWLLATQGSGFLYLTEALQARLTPAAGWLSGPVDWDDVFDYRLAFHPDASRFRLGTLNHIGVVALDAALGLYLDAGPEWCESMVLDLCRMLGDGLEAIGLQRYGTADAGHASGIVTFEHPDAEGLYAYLRGRNIHISLRNRMVRFAPTYYNSPGEVEAVLEAVEAFGIRPA